jgi:hypothetical protein
VSTGVDRCRSVSIDTEGGRRSGYVRGMRDVEIAWCGIRGETLRIERLFASVELDYGTTPHSLRGWSEQLDAIAERELAASGARWTPYYDRMLRDLMARHERLPAHDGAYLVLTDLRADLARHNRLCNLLEAAERRGARLLSEAWNGCTAGPDACLLLGINPDASAVLEPVRRLVLARIGDPATDGLACTFTGTQCETGLALVDATVKASESGTWDAVEGWREAWFAKHEETWSGNAYGEGYFHRMGAVGIATRRDVTLELLFDCVPLEAAELQRVLGNPFDPVG